MIDEYTERVDGYQIRDVAYFGRPPKNAPPRFDIVKWIQHEPKLVTVLHDEDGHWTCREEMSTEYCYSVGTLEWNAHEPCFKFSSIGLRWFEERPSDAVIDMVMAFCEKKGQELQDKYD